MNGVMVISAPHNTLLEEPVYKQTSAGHNNIPLIVKPWLHQPSTGTSMLQTRRRRRRRRRRWWRHRQLASQQRVDVIVWAHTIIYR